jgi:hypothetical protein
MAPIRADASSEHVGAPAQEQNLVQPVTLLPTGPSWLPLPPLTIHATAAKGAVEAVWLSFPPDYELKRVPLKGGTAGLPFRPRTVDDLRDLQILAEKRPGIRVSLEPTQALVLWPVDEGSDETRIFGVVNWGEASGLRAICTDALGRAVPLEGAAEIGNGSYDLGYLQTGFDAQFAVTLPASAAYPLTLAVSDEAGDSVTTTLTRRIEVADNAAPVAWPSETVGPSSWIAYTQLGSAIKDDTGQPDPSKGGSTPQGPADISRGSTSPYFPSCYYAFDSVNQVFFYRVRVSDNPMSQGGYQSGTITSTDPWVSVTWNLLLDTDGDGWKEFAVILAGDSGGGSNSGDDLQVYYNNDNKQDVSVADLVWQGKAGTKNADVPGNPSTDGATWDFGRTRCVYHTTANSTWGDGWFVDFQFFLGALTQGRGGAQLVGVNTPIAFGYTTANGINPIQKDFASSYSYTASPTTPFPYSDVVTLATGITQVPQIGPMSLSAVNCPNSVTVSAYVVDALQVGSLGTVTDTIASATFQYYYDANGNGIADDASTWTNMGVVGSSPNPDTNGNLAPNGTTASFNDWGVVWDTSSLSGGQYLIRVTVVDDPIDSKSNTNTKVIGSYIVDTSGNCRVGNNVSWNSYQDASHLVPQDIFYASGPDTVYMNGSFQPATTYWVAYYASNGAIIGSAQQCTSDTFGTMLSSSLTLTTSSPGGIYHCVVYFGFSPPSAYNGVYDASTNPLLADDTFVVKPIIALLRGYATALNPQTPPNSSIFTHADPADPALSPTSNLEQANFLSEDPFPHQTSDLDATSPPLVFYELSGNSDNTLRVNKDTSDPANPKIIITY